MSKNYTEYKQKLFGLPVLANATDFTVVSRDELVLSHARMVHTVVTGLLIQQDNPLFEDCIQVGMVALAEAADSFDPSKFSNTFATYAIPNIRYSVMEFYNNNKYQFKILTTKPFRKAFFNYRKYAEPDGTITPTSMQRMSTDLGITLDDIRQCIDRVRVANSCISVFDTIPGQDSIYYGDTIPDEETNRPDSILQEFQEYRLIHDEIPAIVSTFNAKEQAVYQYRLNCDEPLKLVEVGAMLNISAERVRQLEHKIITNIKKALELDACV